MFAANAQCLVNLDRSFLIVVVVDTKVVPVFDVVRAYSESMKHKRY